LEEIGIEAKDTLLVVNKIDRLPSVNALNWLLNRYPNAIPISARRRLGFDRLAFAVSDALSRTFCDVDIETAVDNGRLMAYLAAHGEVLSKRFDAERATIHCRIPRKYLARISQPGTHIHFRDTAGDAVAADSARGECPAPAGSVSSAATVAGGVSLLR